MCDFAAILGQQTNQSSRLVPPFELGDTVHWYLLNEVCTLTPGGFGHLK
jgi:hypothetical protein